MPVITVVLMKRLVHCPLPDAGDGCLELEPDVVALALLHDPPAVDHHALHVLGGRGEDHRALVPAGSCGPRAGRVDDDEVGAPADGDRAGVVPAERARARRWSRRQQLGGGPVTALLGGQPLVELDGAHLLEEVDHRVAVGAEGQARARVVQPTARPDAVAEVALGRRAEARVGAGSADQLDVVVGEVGGVHQAGRRAQQAVVREQPRRA